MTSKVLFIGCGKVAIGAANLLSQSGITMHGVRRDTTTLPEFMQTTSADVSNISSLKFLKESTADTIVYSLAASKFDEESYIAAYITGLQNVIASCNFNSIKRLIFVSSTAVYHQNDGSIVDEHSPTHPVQFNGKVMHSAEQLALDTGIGTALRFSGIYGRHGNNGRNRLIERVRSGNCTPEHITTYTNRIHSQDCSAVLAHLIMQAALPEVILGTDSKPAISTEVESYIADKLGISKQYTDSNSKVKRIAGSKQCCNRQLLNTGFKFTYPSYKEGYDKLINPDF